MHYTQHTHTTYIPHIHTHHTHLYKPWTHTLYTVLSHSVVSDSLRPHGLYPARLLCPWGFSRQEYWVGHHALLTLCATHIYTTYTYTHHAHILYTLHTHLHQIPIHTMYIYYTHCTHIHTTHTYTHHAHKPHTYTSHTTHILLPSLKPS